jgi:S-adenosylmethionine hydrolase
VIKRIAPEVQVIDITHGIPPQQVLQGALVLASTVPYMPAGVHLAVVDPGVGTARRALAIRDREGRLYVGPDNGLLLPAVERMGGLAAAHEIANRKYALEPISRTFHGRDVFAPAAAHLASGVDIAELGPEVEVETLQRLDIPTPDIGTSLIGASILYVDRFGNIELNLSRDDLERVGIEPGEQLELVVGPDRYYAVAARTFADVRKGDIMLYEDAYGNVAVAISGGNAASMLKAKPGGQLRIGFRQ